MSSGDESDHDDATRCHVDQRAHMRAFELQLAEEPDERPAAVRQQSSRNDADPLSHANASEISPSQDVNWMKDRIAAQVWQFFSDIEGFHLGDLDLAGRSPSRYEKLKRKWDAFLDDFDLLAPYLSEAEVYGPHYDTTMQEWVEEVYKAKVLTNEAVWAAFCAKWKLSPPIPYEDLAALTEHTRKIVADNPQPKFQNASLEDMPPEIIHAVFSHLAGHFKDGHNLAATSKFFHEIGFNYVFEYRNIVLGADHNSHPIKARAIADINAEVRAKMTWDRGTLLKHIKFLVSRPDICRRIRRVRVANNWGNASWVRTAYAGSAYIHLVRLDDRAMFGPVLRALGNLLRRVSLTRLELEFLPFDKKLVLAICAQDHLVELRLKDCSVPRSVQLFYGGIQPDSRPAPPQSNVRYLCLKDLPYLSSSLWNSLELYPNLRSLQAIASASGHGFMLPDDQVDWHPSVMCSLERLELYSLEPVCVPTLATWFTEHDQAFRLHHVKLISTSCIAVEWINLLLRALHGAGAPLRTLMLDGVDYRNEPSVLLDLIAQLFPDLEGLAVACRPPGHRGSRPCVWPRPTHEYAAPLRAFTRLRCFGANFDIAGVGAAPNLRGAFSSVVDHAFNEKSRIGESPEVGGSSSSSEGSKDHPQLLTQALVGPFAAACPSLRYFVTSGAQSLPEYCCQIARAETGMMSIKDTMPCAPEATPEVIQLYNPLALLRFD